MAESQVKIEELLYQIITDRRYLSAMDSTGGTVDLMVRSLTPLERTCASFIYRQAYSKAKQAGLLSEKQCMADAIQKGLWTKDKEKLISLYKIELQQLEKEKSLFSQSTNKGKKHKLHMNLIKVRKKLEVLEVEEERYSLNSLEGFANQIRANYIVGRMVLNSNGKPIWPTHDNFLEENDGKFITSIISEVNKLSVCNEKQIRKVARSPQWSIAWGASKTSGDTLFGRPSTTYTTEQALLCYWAMMYDSVYESLEKPSDKVINDDEALDKWFETQKDKRDKDNKKRTVGQDIFHGHASGGASQQEQFIMVDNEEDADDIIDLNDKWTLARIQDETKQIEEAGMLDEFALRKNIVKRRLQLENSDKFAEQRKAQAGRVWLG